MNEKVLKFALMLRAVDNVTGPLRGMLRATEACDKAAEKTRGLVEMSERVKVLGEHIVATGLAIDAFVGESLHKFAELESAQVFAQLPFMTKTGTDERFAEVSEKVGGIARLTKMTRENVFGIVETMKRSGVDIDAILSGGLEAAGKLAVVLKDMPGEQVGELVGSISKGLQVSGQDLPRLVDLLARVRNAFGVDLNQIQEMAILEGPSLAALGVKGFEATRGILAFGGALYQAGIRGRSLTTVFRSVMASLPTLDDRLKKNADISDILRRNGIALQFFDSSGRFRGFENFIAQLQKLNRLSTEQRNTVLQEIGGGGQGTNGLAAIANLGTQGFRDAQAAIENTASLSQQFAKVIERLSKVFDGVGHAVLDFVAALGEGLAPVATVVLDKLTDWIEDLTAFIEHHKKLTTAVMAVVAAVGIMLTFVGFAILALGFYAGWVFTAGVRTAVFEFALSVARLGLGKMVGGLVDAAESLFAFATEAMPAAIAAAWSFTIALLANPITWIVATIIAAVALLAYAVYRYWRPISRFVGDLWNDVQRIFERFGRWLNSFSLFREGAKIAKSLVDGIRSVVPDWLLTLLTLGPVGGLAVKVFHAATAAEPASEAAASTEPASRATNLTNPAVRVANEILPATILTTPTLRAATEIAPASRVTTAAVPVLRAATEVEPASRAAQRQSVLTERAASRPSGIGGLGIGGLIHYAPQLTVEAGASPETVVAAQRALDQDRSQFEKMIERVLARIQEKDLRLSYGR